MTVFMQIDKVFVALTRSQYFHMNGIYQATKTKPVDAIQSLNQTFYCRCDDAINQIIATKMLKIDS